MAHMQLLPGDQRLVDQIIYELKSKGIFDQFRKECIADVDTRPAYQNLRQRVETSVSNFLNRQRWRPDLNKNQLREKLRKHILDGNYLEQGVERIVDQVVNPKVASVFIPQVEDLVYNYLGIKRHKPVNINSNADTSNGKNIEINNLLPTDLEAVSPDSVKSHHDDKNEATDEPAVPETKGDDKVCLEMKMDVDVEVNENDNESLMTPPQESLTNDEHLDLQQNVQEIEVHDLTVTISDESIDSKSIPLPKEMNLECIPEPTTAPPSDLLRITNISNISMDIPLPDEIPPKENAATFEEFHDSKPLTASDDDFSSDSSLRRNVSPITPIRNFNNENSSDAQQGFVSNNSNDVKIEDKSTIGDISIPISMFRFTIESKDSSESSPDIPKKNPSSNVEQSTLSYQFQNRINLNTFSTPVYDDSSSSNNLHIDYESDAHSKTNSDFKDALEKVEKSADTENKDQKRTEKTTDHKSSHNSRDTHRHRSHSKDRRSDLKHSNSKDRKNSKHDKKSSKSEQNSSKSQKHHSSRERFRDSEKKASKDEKPKTTSDKKEDKELTKSKHTSHKSSSSHRDSKSHHKSSSLSRHSSTHSNTSKYSDEKYKSNHRNKHSSDSKSSKTRDHSKSSSLSRSEKEKLKNSSKTKYSDDKDKKEKKVTDDHYSSSGRGNHSRRSTDRDSNDGNSSSSKSSNLQSSTKSADNKKESKTSSSKSGGSSSSETTNQSDNLERVADSTVIQRDEMEMGKKLNNEDEKLQMKPVVRIESHLGTPIAESQNTSLPTNVPLKKPKFAANIHEARKLMKMRKLIDLQEQKRFQDATLLLELQQNIQPNVSQVYSAIPGPELEFACMTVNKENKAVYENINKSLIQEPEVIRGGISIEENVCSDIIEESVTEEGGILIPEPNEIKTEIIDTVLLHVKDKSDIEKAMVTEHEDMINNDNEKIICPSTIRNDEEEINENSAIIKEEPVFENCLATSIIDMNESSVIKPDKKQVTQEIINDDKDVINLDECKKETKETRVIKEEVLIEDLSMKIGEDGLSVLENNNKELTQKIEITENDNKEFSEEMKIIQIDDTISISQNKKIHQEDMTAKCEEDPIIENCKNNEFEDSSSATKQVYDENHKIEIVDDEKSGNDVKVNIPDITVTKTRTDNTNTKHSEYFEITVICEETTDNENSCDKADAEQTVNLIQSIKSLEKSVDTKNAISDRNFIFFSEQEKYNAEIERYTFVKFYELFLKKYAQQKDKLYLINCDAYEEAIFKDVCDDYEIVNYYRNGSIRVPNKTITEDLLNKEIILPVDNLKNTDKTPVKSAPESPLFSPVKSDCSFDLSSDYDARLDEMINKTTKKEIMEIILGESIEDAITEKPNIRDAPNTSNRSNTRNLKRKLSNSSENNNDEILTLIKIRKNNSSEEISTTDNNHKNTCNGTINTRSKYLGKATRVGLSRPRKRSLPQSPCSDKSVENYEENDQCKTPEKPNGKLNCRPQRSKQQRYDTSDLYKPKSRYLSRRGNMS